MQMSIHLFVFKGHFREDFQGGSGGNRTSRSIEKAVIWSLSHALYAREGLVLLRRYLYNIISFDKVL